MTIYATPGGTPLNQTGGFQGTQPGNPVGASLSPVNPGVGLFPPNSDTHSGDTVLAAQSRGAMPSNVLTTNYGTRDSRPGQAVLEIEGKGAMNGAGVTATNSSLWANGGSCGGNSLGAGGMNQTDGPGAGDVAIIATNAPATMPTIASPAQYQG
jgi:hypothetical protein